MDAQQLKALDALVGGNNYDDETLTLMLKPYEAYLKASEELRKLDLGEVRPPFAFFPGGRK